MVLPDFLERKEEDAEWLMDRAKRARDHVDRQTQAFHKNCGQAERVLRVGDISHACIHYSMGSEGLYIWYIWCLFRLGVPGKLRWNG